MREPCDCLNYCGDDPRVARGQVKPCKQRKARDALHAMPLDTRIDEIAQRIGISREELLSQAIAPFEWRAAAARAKD